ncbi:MAG: hypothetical protein ACLS63_02835 [Flavonifractor plautii]
MAAVRDGILDLQRRAAPMRGSSSFSFSFAWGNTSLLRSFPAYHSGNAAITQEKNEVFPSAKRNLPQELRYIVRNESILAKM